MTTLDDLLEPRERGETGFRVEVPDGWQQGRGAFGGLVLGQMVRAAERSERDPSRRLRSLTAELVAPVLPGPAQVVVEELRRGSSLSAYALRYLQQGEVQAHAVAILAAARAPEPAWNHFAPPALPPWQAVPAIPLGESGIGPAFARYFEYRPVAGAPFSGGAAAATEGYLQSRLPISTGGAAVVTALADVWWSAAVVPFASVKPFATIAFTLQLVADPATVDVTAPVFHRARAQVLAEGYALEQRELWTPDGRLLAINPQTVAVLG